MALQINYMMKLPCGGDHPFADMAAVSSDWRSSDFAEERDFGATALGFCKELHPSLPVGYPFHVVKFQQE